MSPKDSIVPASDLPDNYKGSLVPQSDLPGNFQKLASRIPKDKLPAPEWAGRHPNLYGVAGAAKEAFTPLAEGLALAGGSILGTPAGPAGQVAGAGLGYAAARRIMGIADYYLGNTSKPTVRDVLTQTSKDVLSGGSMEAGGQVAGAVLSKGLSAAGNLAKQALGATTGAGPGTIEEALKGSEAFKNAMRGSTKAEEIIDNTRNALQALREQRAANYQTELEKFSQEKGPIDLAPIKDKLSNLLQDYHVKVNDAKAMIQGAPEYDFSRSTLDKAAQNDVMDVINTVKDWGKKTGDDSPAMIDVLKRRIDNFYSESSQARQFVASLRSTIKDTLTDKVPQYARMTKGYAEASDLIDEVQKGLMLKSGQTADQTLRRLTSAMRENFEMRRDLVNILGNKSGQDLMGQVAGYSASQKIPRGLVGKLAGGYGVFHLLDPKFWPLILASSPRAVGEFLNVYGKVLAESSGASQAIGRTASYATGKKIENNKEKGSFLRSLLNAEQTPSDEFQQIINRAGR